jgi:hypothetical protein
MSEIKTGREIVDEFFQKILEISNVDVEIASRIKKLYDLSKFTESQLKNLLDEIIEQKKEEKSED